ncbi:MAG TPA: thiamine phosphate synthase [Mariprofundaceae bacterium]|nr:thiamine phosphate synthase [Mariprofundaceae bacterium]
MAKNLTGIYGILPDSIDTADLLGKAEQALKGGVRILQLRDKKLGFKKTLQRAQKLRELTSHYDARLVINDSLQIALESRADGVHLGREDEAMHLPKVRQEVGKELLIGITCRADAAFAKFVLDGGADYVSFGAIWTTHSKPEVPEIGLARLAKARQMFPEANICAIGGIDRTKLAEVKAAGADCAAVISGLFGAQDIESEAKAMLETWEKA